MSEQATTSPQLADGDLLWKPGPTARQDSKLGPFMDKIEAEHDIHFADFEEFRVWSVANLETFWRSLWNYFEVGPLDPEIKVLQGQQMPDVRWFEGAKLNYAEYLINKAAERPDEVAVIAHSQTRDVVQVTYGQLIEQVARARVGLQRLGITKGDRVAGFLPNAPEALVAFLATASLGAIWSSCAPEFGAPAVIDRFAQTEPRVLLTIGGYTYGDKPVNCTDKVTAIVAGLPSVEHVVTIPYGDYHLDADLGTSIDSVVEWKNLLSDHAELVFESVEFDHPLFVLFSSGTTGLPKPIVHGHGGILLEHLKSHHFSWDLGDSDRMFWFTTTAWMMWNALVSSLLLGCSIVMVDGNPLFPDLHSQWRLASETDATFLGLSPAYVMSCRKAGLNPTAEYDLSKIRKLAAAGSPLPAEGYLWVHDQFGDDAPLNVGSGGTDVCTGIVQGYPLTPVYVGEMSGRCLAIETAAFDDEGNAVVDELGELVITTPMPSMPLGFWGDDGTKFRATYFDMYPGVFRFGDWIRFSEHGSCIITGRSDATLNRGGVRLGTAELYRVIEEDPRVADSLVVHLEDADGGPGELILFLVTQGQVTPQGELTDELTAELRSQLRQALSPRHVPDTVISMPSVPRNLTGKKLELPIKKLLQGAAPEKVLSRDAMANPEVLDEYLSYVAERSSRHD